MAESKYIQALNPTDLGFDPIDDPTVPAADAAFNVIKRNIRSAKHGKLGHPVDQNPTARYCGNFGRKFLKFQAKVRHEILLY